MANYWTKNSGEILLTLEEQKTIAPYDLPLSQPLADIKIISGSLPGGLYLDGTQLKALREKLLEILQAHLLYVLHMME